MLSNYKIRAAKISDQKAIFNLYQKVAQVPEGIARTKDEITENYISNFIENSLKNGLIFVAENPKNSDELIAEIHCYKHDPKCFDKTFGNTTLVVDQDFHGFGIGKKIFSHLLDEIKNNHPDIARVELMVRQSNPKAINLYQKLGFKIEGICRKRILNSSGELDDDTMMAWFNE